MEKLCIAPKDVVAIEKEKAHKAIKSQAQISAGSASHKEPVTNVNSPIVSQGPPNQASPPPPPQNSHSDQVESKSSPETVKGAVIWWRQDEI